MTTRKDTTSSTLVRSRRIMTHDLAQSTEGLVCYATDESESGYIPSRIFIHRTDLADMGNPWKITVTVESGDLLNETVRAVDAGEVYIDRAGRVKDARTHEPVSQ